MAIFIANRALEAVFQGDAGNDTIRANLFVDTGGEDYTTTALADLAGGVGDDSIRLTIEAYEAAVASTIRGGDGVDDISIDIFSQSAEPNVNFDLDGGAGDDAVAVRIRSYSSGVEVPTNSFVRGAEGNDVISVELYEAPGTTNRVNGGGDNDTITALVSSLTEEGFGIGNDVFGGSGDDLMTLTAISGGNSANPFNEASGGDGADRITARIEMTMFDLDSTARNTVYGGEGDDRLTAIIVTDGAMSGFSELFGGAGDDRLKVSGGNENFLWGNVGDDTLLGGVGNDNLIGGQGNDYLRGYAGDDAFEFQSARDGERDRIDGFVIGDDVIDVSRIDANAFRGGNQAFTFDATGDGGTGRIWLEDYGTRSIVHADTGRAVLDIVLLDGGATASDYSASDFIL